MTKDQLRTGMLVQTRNGDWYIVQIGAKEYFRSIDYLINLKSGTYLNIKDYNQDLTERDMCKYDIVKVIECEYIGNVFRGIQDDLSPEQFDGAKVIWQRTEVNPKVQQLESLIEKLKSQLESAEGELKSIKSV